MSYGDLLDLVEERFATVHVLGQSSFIGYSVVELGAEAEPEVVLDGRLMGGDVEEVGAYLVLCRVEAPEASAEPWPYGILQTPTQGDAGLERWWDSLGEGADDSEELETEAEPDEEVEVEVESEDQDHSDAEDDSEADPVDVDVDDAPASPGPEPETDVDLSRYTDAEGGRVSRWRWSFRG